MNKSKIDWCDYTWNPVTGCYHGCSYCYAKRVAERFGKKFPDYSGYPIDHNGCHIIDSQFIDTPYPYIFEPTLHAYRLDEPIRKTKGAKIFVCSMADLFGEWVPDEWIEDVFKTVNKCPQHTFMFLTKNPRKYGFLNGKFYNYNCKWPENACFGTTITKQEDAKRIRDLPYGSAKTFLSIEPMIGPVDLSFYLPKPTTRCKCSYCGHHADNYSSHCQHCGKNGGYSGSFRKQPINWVIIGAQTGPGAIPTKPEWVQSIIDQCRAAGVPVFLKDNLNWPEKIQEYPW